jgi:hypothetical protein
MENPSSPRESISQFEKLLAGMARAGIDFAVAGGVAVILNGYPRQTRDADIIIHPDEVNIRRLLDYLATWGEGWARELTLGDFKTLDEGSLRVMEEFDLDIFVKLRGRTLDDFRPRLRHLQSDDVRIPVLSPEDLIHCKAASWRDKDKLDVLAMQEILRRESGTEGS